jgi:hypothetical protein
VCLAVVIVGKGATQPIKNHINTHNELSFGDREGGKETRNEACFAPWQDRTEPPFDRLSIGNSYLIRFLVRVSLVGAWKGPCLRKDHYGSKEVNTSRATGM